MVIAWILGEVFRLSASWGVQKYMQPKYIFCNSWKKQNQKHYAVFSIIYAKFKFLLKFQIVRSVSSKDFRFEIMIQPGHLCTVYLRCYIASELDTVYECV